MKTAIRTMETVGYYITGYAIYQRIHTDGGIYGGAVWTSKFCTVEMLHKRCEERWREENRDGIKGHHDGFTSRVILTRLREETNLTNEQFQLERALNENIYTGSLNRMSPLVQLHNRFGPLVSQEIEALRKAGVKAAQSGKDWKRNNKAALDGMRKDPTIQAKWRATIENGKNDLKIVDRKRKVLANTRSNPDVEAKRKASVAVALSDPEIQALRKAGVKAAQSGKDWKRNNKAALDGMRKDPTIQANRIAALSLALKNPAVQIKRKETRLADPEKQAAHEAHLKEMNCKRWNVGRNKPCTCGKHATVLAAKVAEKGDVK